MPPQQQKEKDMYPPEIVIPMKQDITSAGVEELLTPEEVDSAIKADGTPYYQFVLLYTDDTLAIGEDAEKILRDEIEA